MTASQTAQIEQGRTLHRLLNEDPDFTPFRTELENRIAEAQEKLYAWTPASTDYDLVARKTAHAALKSLRDWIDEEILEGGRLFMRAQAEVPK